MSREMTLPEAMDALQKANQLDVKNWEIALAELKSETDAGHSGRYWHFQYTREPGTDGGVGAHHFFVWDDLLVEHVLDGKQRSIPDSPTADLIKTVSTPAF